MASDLKLSIEDLLISVPSVNSVALLSSDGLPIYSVTAEDYNDDTIMLITSTFQNLTDTIQDELKFKKLTELIIRSESGLILINHIFEMDALLYISAASEVKLGILIMEARRTISKLIKGHN